MCVCIYIYIYISYIYIYMCVCMCVYIHIRVVSMCDRVHTCNTAYILPHLKLPAFLI